MTDEGALGKVIEPPAEVPPDRFQTFLFCASLVAILIAWQVWLVTISHKFKVIYDQLGMTELPFITQVTLDIGFNAKIMVPIVVLALIAYGTLVLRRGSRRILNRCTAVNWIVVALMPGYVYFALHMPIMELQKKLGGVS